MRQIVTVCLVAILLPVAVVWSQERQVLDRTAQEQAPTEQGTENADRATRSPLQDLDWMVGRWTDKGEVATISTHCNWTFDGKFLARKFEITAGDEVTLKGTQIIGWDPIEGQVRSWTFDSQGGVGSGRWIRDGNRWLVKTSFVLASGERASAINIITYVDQDTLRWQSTNREIAGELQPNIPEVTVARQTAEKNTSNKKVKEDSQ